MRRKQRVVYYFVDSRYPEDARDLHYDSIDLVQVMRDEMSEMIFINQILPNLEVFNFKLSNPEKKSSDRYKGEWPE